MFTGSFADKELLELSYRPIRDGDGLVVSRSYGWVMGGDGRLLVTASVGIVTIFGWVLGHMVSGMHQVCSFKPSRR